MKLEEQTCSTNIGATPLSGRQVDGLLAQVTGWFLSGREIRREFRLKDFRQAMELDIHISYNRVTLILTTHAIEGLSMNDFILAARINLLPNIVMTGKAA